MRLESKKFVEFNSEKLFVAFHDAGCSVEWTGEKPYGWESMK